VESKTMNVVEFTIAVFTSFCGSKTFTEADASKVGFISNGT